MMESTWEKSPIQDVNLTRANGERLKFLIGGGIALAAIFYLILSGTMTGARYFITIEELLNNQDYVGQTVRISGAVIGETIIYDTENLIIDFTIAHIPAEVNDLAFALYQAVKDPNSARLPIHIRNEVMPDLLQNEAQAILTGQLGEDGIFYATELLLKCPSRYEEAAPNQIALSSQD